MAENWWSNPSFKKFASEALQDFGYGLSNSTNFGNAFGVANNRMQELAPYRAQMNLMDEEMAKQEQQTNVTRDWLAAQGYDDLVPLVDAGQAGLAYSEALKRMQPADTTANQNDFLFARSNGYEGTFEDWVNGAGSSGQYGLTPIWGQLPDGTFAYGVQGKDGTFQRVDTGDLTPLDPRTTASERAFGAATGKASGEATAAAQGDLDAGLAALDILDQIKTHPELGWATGTSAGFGGNKIPGTGRYDFQNLVDQAKSGAFLIAVQEMRGLGALSNAEGGAATQAITRMDTATSKEAFLRALSDYETIIQRGVERARARLADQQQQPPASGQTFVYNPATGRLE